MSTAMEVPMRLPLTVLVIALSGPALADPPKVVAAKPAVIEKREPEIVLAAADPIRSSAPDQARPIAPARRVAPRVTTCRCGDPEPASETPDQ